MTRPVCALLLAVSVSLSARQLPPRDAVTPTTGTASVAGIVVTDEEQPRPVRRAIVTLSGVGLAPSRGAITDDDGRFVFSNLPGGRFTMTASRASFVTSVYGAKRPGRPGTPINVEPGQSVAALVLKMWRGAAIAGTLRDDRGQPVAGVPVTAVAARANSGTGLRTLSNNGVKTDDRGEFRIFGLEPGSYVVSVQPSAGSGAPLIAPSTAEVDAMLAAAQRGVAPRIDPQPAAAPSEPAKPFDYTSVFYPGTPSIAQATPITLVAGQEVTGIDFSLQRVSTSVVSGVVTRPDGAPAAGASIQLIAVWANALFAPDTPRVINATAGPDGAFRIAQVTPGEYRLESQMPVQAPRPSAGAGFVSAGNIAPALFAQTTVSVLGRDIEGLTLPLDPTMTVSGSVVFDGAAPRPDPTKLRLWLKPAGLPTKPGASINRLLMPPNVSVRADGTFEIPNVTPGAYQLMITPLDGTTAAWVPRSAPLGERDLLDGFVEVPRLSDPRVTVTLSDRRTELSGTLQSASGGPVSDVFVIAFSSNRTYWLPSARRVQAMRPDADGRFVIRDLPPGEYLVSAVTDVDPDEWQDPAFLEKLIGAAAKVTLAEGEKRTFDLRLGGGVLDVPNGTDAARVFRDAEGSSQEPTMNKNQRDGAVDQAKGKVKQAVGHVTDDDDLKAEGKADEVIGKAKSAVGGAQQKVGDAVERAGKAIKK